MSRSRMMKFKLMSVACASIVVVSAIISICGETPIWGQQTTGTLSEPAIVESYRVVGDGRVVREARHSNSSLTVEESPASLRNKEVGLVDGEIRKGLKQYQEAKTDEEKKQAEEIVSAALSKYFDVDMKNREEEVQAIEERVKKLRAQLDSRREAKEQLIQLQFQVLINEANGLGFYSQSPLLNGPEGRTGVPIYSSPPATYAPGALVPPQRPPFPRGEEYPE